MPAGEDNHETASIGIHRWRIVRERKRIEPRLYYVSARRLQLAVPVNDKVAWNDLVIIISSILRERERGREREKEREKTTVYFLKPVLNWANVSSRT